MVDPPPLNAISQVTLMWTWTWIFIPQCQRSVDAMEHCMFHIMKLSYFRSTHITSYSVMCKGQTNIKKFHTTDQLHPRQAQQTKKCLAAVGYIKLN